MSAHLSKAMSDCKAECGTFMRTGMQYEHAPSNAYTHWNSYIEGLEHIDADLLAGKEDRAPCYQQLHDIHRSAPGVAAWEAVI